MPISLAYWTISFDKLCSENYLWFDFNHLHGKDLISVVIKTISAETQMYQL